MPSTSNSYLNVESFGPVPSLPSTSTPPQEYPVDHYHRNSSLKKRNVDRACDACRRRKTKCDGPKMPDNICSKCAQNRKPCTYLEASKPRGPPKAYISALEDRLESLEGLLKRLRPDQDFSEDLGPPIVIDSWKSDDTAMNSSVDVSASHTIASTSSLPSGPSTSRHAGNTDLFRTLRSPNDPNDSDSDSDSTSNHFYSSDSDGLVDKYTTGMERLTLRGQDATAEEDENHARFHGKSSSMNLIDATRKFKQLHIQQTMDPEGGNAPSNVSSAQPASFGFSFTRRPEYWRFPKWEFVWEGLHIQSPEVLSDVLAKFPPPELADSLFTLYFHHVNILFPLLHRPTFERQWKGRLHERNIWFACLVMSIFAVASRWSQDLRVLPESEQNKPPEVIDWTLSGWKYFAVCIGVHRMRRSLFFPASLFEIQTFNTLSLFLRGASTQTAAWLFITMGMRKAQDAGAHRKTIYNRTPTVDDELWRRAFWMLVGLDRVTSAGLGRPCSVDEENFDLDPPLDIDDEYWENDDPALAFRQPEGKPSKVTSFVLWLSLTDIIAFALRTIYTVRPSSVLMAEMTPPTSEDLVKQLDNSLTKWVDQVPEHHSLEIVRWSEDMQDHIISNQATMLYNTYHFTQILVHRPFMRPLRIANLDRNVSSTSSDLAICCSAAKSCVRIIEKQMQHGYSNVIELIHISQVAAAVLIIEIWHLKAKERLYRATSRQEDTKPKYFQNVQELLDDIEIIIKALEWAKPRYGYVPLVLAKLREALPSPEDEEASAEIPMYSFNDAAEAPTESSSVEGSVPHVPPAIPQSSTRHVQSVWSAGSNNTGASTMSLYPTTYLPLSASSARYPLNTGDQLPHTSIGDGDPSNGAFSTRTQRPLQSDYWQPTSPAGGGQYPVHDRMGTPHVQPTRRSDYGLSSLETVPNSRYYGGVDAFNAQHNPTFRAGNGSVLDSRGVHHEMSDARSVPTPYHPFSIKDPEYR
ncbi:hypothetical protein V5O48_008757 [Marasmius crinis-equi]|uniref:Zn(2)-C6 fungal-type domain-containing protein n=1 Tax=Marasmius crinis-equi TaxID=585013 RepID=A0ABR3FD06_9AGAR